MMTKDASGHAPLDPIALTRQLCEIESTTYHEGAVGDFLAAFLTARGWQVEKTPVPQPPDGAAGPRWNVYAGLQGQTPELVFSTHMDTVPPYIAFSEDAEFMYGRGVSDAKGIIAAQVAAAEALRAAGLRIGLLFVSGEERDSAGAKAANLAPKGSRFLINGEPTDNRLALASKGALRAVFRSTGKMAHSAYPELGDSAVHKLVQVMAKLLELEMPVIEDVGPGTLNIGQIQGGHAPNVIADKPKRRCWCGWWATRPRCAPRCSMPRQIWQKWTSRWRFPSCACAQWRDCPPCNREVHHRYSAALQLGRAAAARSRQHSRGAHAF
jgi:acetylornithine deacetylase